MGETRLLAGLLVLGAGVAGWEAISPAPAHAEAEAVQNLPAAVERYALARASRDAAQIAALHTADPAFNLVIGGEPPVVGRAANSGAVQ